jgi:hypothetical protein
VSATPSAARVSNWPSRSISAFGESAFGTGEDGFLHDFDGVDAVERHGGAGGGHAEFERIKPDGVGAAAFQECVALAHGLLVGGAGGGVAGEVGEHLTIEETAAVACGAGEDAVHRGGEPDDAHQLAEIVLRGVHAVEAGGAFGATLIIAFEGQGQLAVDIAVADVGGEGPAACGLAFGVAADEVGEFGAAQAAARRQHGDGFHEVGLA